MEGGGGGGGGQQLARRHQVGCSDPCLWVQDRKGRVGTHLRWGTLLLQRSTVKSVGEGGGGRGGDEVRGYLKLK